MMSLILLLQFVHVTPLLSACVQGRTRTASLLIEAGANINYKDEVIYTCSEEAILYDKLLYHNIRRNFC